jgi:hypothetical protein
MNKKRVALISAVELRVSEAIQRETAENRLHLCQQITRALNREQSPSSIKLE